MSDACGGSVVAARRSARTSLPSGSATVIVASTVAPFLIVARDAMRGRGTSSPTSWPGSAMRACFVAAMRCNSASSLVTTARWSSSDVASWLAWTRKVERRLPKLDAPTRAPPASAVAFCCHWLRWALRTSVSATAVVSAAVSRKRRTAYRVTGSLSAFSSYGRRVVIACPGRGQVASAVPVSRASPVRGTPSNRACGS